MEKRKCGFIEHFNLKPTLMKCNCMTFTEQLERNQLSLLLSFSATGDNRIVFSLHT